MTFPGGITTNLRCAERDRAEPVVSRILTSDRLRSRLVLMIYNEAGPDQPLLSERGIRDTLDMLLGDAVPPSGGISHPMRGTDPEHGIMTRIVSPPVPTGSVRGTAPTPVSPPKMGGNKGAPKEPFLDRVKRLLAPHPGPDMFVTMTAYASGVGRFDPDRNRMVLLPGTRISTRPESRFAHMGETIRHIRSRESTRRVGNFTLELGEELETISPSFAATLVAGQTRHCACWRDRDGQKMRAGGRTQNGTVLGNGLRVMFPGETRTETSEQQGHDDE